MMESPAFKPKKMPTQARARATWNAILEATAQLLKEEGYDRLSTNRVAKRAGVSVGSLYQYFGNKETLVMALFDRHMGAMMSVVRARLLAVYDEADLQGMTPGVIDAIIEGNSVDPVMLSVLTREIPELGQSERIAEIDREGEQLMMAVMDNHADLHRITDQEAAAFVLVHGVMGAVHAAIRLRPDLIASGRFTREVSDMIFRYLSSDPDSDRVAGAGLQQDCP